MNVQDGSDRSAASERHAGVDIGVSTVLTSSAGPELATPGPQTGGRETAGAPKDWLRLARLAHLRGDWQAECESLQQAHAVSLLTDRQRARLIELMLATGRGRDSLSAARGWHNAAPTSTAARVCLAKVLIATGDIDEADGIIGSLMAVLPQPAAVIAVWAQFMIEHRGRPEDVAERLRRLPDAERVDPIIAIWLARALAAAHRHADAIDALQAAVDRDPANTALRMELGSHQTRSGCVAAGHASFMRASELDPCSASALRLAGYEHTFSAGDALFRRIEDALKLAPRLPLQSQVELEYAAAKAREDVGDLERAFAHYERAGALQKQLRPWSAEPLARLVALLEGGFRVEEHAAARARGHATDRPVLIIGMPRSGTTLVEQIIAAHPACGSAGETPFAAEALHGVSVSGQTLATLDPRRNPLGAAVRGRDWEERGRAYVAALRCSCPGAPLRIVDKMPGNYTWAGLIDAAVPGSKFIHCRRHPIDTCLSQFRLYFGDEVPFCYGLEDLASVYRLYHRLMQHWADVLPPGSILEVRYEDVVADLDGEAQRIIAHIGLDWDEACKSFHANATTVRTASAAQVRRPLYQTAVGSWTKYRAFLGPLIDELADLTEEYERRNA